MKKASKGWALGFFGAVGVLLLLLCGKTLLLDPYFHYHKPLPGIAVPGLDSRYQNDGILRNFDYDTIITGSSMAENFKSSELDALFGVHSVKVALFGSTYHEIYLQTQTALKRTPNLKMVFQCLDYNGLIRDPQELRYDASWYPQYLYDDNPFNDVYYLMNKTVLLTATDYVLQQTLEGKPAFSMDEYCRWADWYALGRDAINETYTRPGKSTATHPLTDEDRATIQENLELNVLSLAEENPDVTFYLFFSPYSIFFWDRMDRTGNLQRQLDAEKYAIELLLTCDNIRLYSFFDEYDMVCDADNYRDAGHYGEHINSRILQWMREDEHRLTKENYENYCAANAAFYGSYDYDALFAQ